MGRVCGFPAPGYHLGAKQKARARPGPTPGIVSGSGFCSGLSPPEKQKHLSRYDLPHGFCSAQALVTVDAGSGAWIFTIVSCPQRLHLRGRFRTAVSGRVSSSFPFPHTGQMTHPSLMTSLSGFLVICNAFPSLSTQGDELLRLVSSRKIIKPVAVGLYYMYTVPAPAPGKASTVRRCSRRSRRGCAR